MKIQKIREMAKFDPFVQDENVRKTLCFILKFGM